MSPSTSWGLLRGADESKRGHENIFGRKDIRSLGPFMCMLLGIRERTCQSKAHADQYPGSNRSKVQVLRRRFRQFCLIPPHPFAMQTTYVLGKVDQKAQKVLRMNGLVFFPSKESSKFWEFQLIYCRKLWGPQKIDGGESQTKLKTTREERLQWSFLTNSPSKEGSRSILIKIADSRSLEAFTARQSTRHTLQLSRCWEPFGVDRCT